MLFFLLRIKQYDPSGCFALVLLNEDCVAAISDEITQSSQSNWLLI